MSTDISSPAPAKESVGKILVRNTLYLTVAQALTMPLSMVVNAAMARFLGPLEFGYLYLATTIATFGALAVEWGHHGALPALVARDHSRAGRLLLTSVAFRAATSVITYVTLAIGCHLFGYGAAFQLAFALVFLLTAVSSVVGAAKDTIRGFERTDIAAFAHVGQHTLAALMALGVLFLGGRLPSVLSVQVLAATFALLYVARNLRGVGVTGFGFDRGALSELSRMGTAFVFSGVAMVLTPNIDALYLSKLAPEEVMGWYAVGRRLIGVLLFPASALIGALYPTLCRLFTTDMPGFARATRGAIQSVTLLAIPLALGCGLYPEIGIMIFSRDAFGPAEDNLRILSVYLFLVYVSMPLGTAIVAANMQKGWAMVQLLSVLVSLSLDPILIPMFQDRYGNGGMGLCVATVLSELAVVAFGVAMSPKGIFDRGLWRTLGLGFLAGGAMIAVAVLLRSISPFLGAPVALVAYAATLWVTGGIDRALAARGLEAVRRKLGRKNA